MVSRHSAYDRSTPFSKRIETRSLLGTLINLAAALSIVSISISGSFRGNVQKEMRSSWDFQTQLAALNKSIWIFAFQLYKKICQGLNFVIRLASRSRTSLAGVRKRREEKREDKCGFLWFYEGHISLRK